MLAFLSLRPSRKYGMAIPTRRSNPPEVSILSITVTCCVRWYASTDYNVSHTPVSVPPQSLSLLPSLNHDIPHPSVRAPFTLLVAKQVDFPITHFVVQWTGGEGDLQKLRVLPRSVNHA